MDTITMKMFKEHLCINEVFHIVEDYSVGTSTFYYDSFAGFNHSFTINDNLDSDGIDATVVDGVLVVSIPYAEAVKPRKIEVKVK